MKFRCGFLDRLNLVRAADMPTPRCSRTCTRGLPRQVVHGRKATQTLRKDCCLGQGRSHGTVRERCHVTSLTSLLTRPLISSLSCGEAAQFTRRRTASTGWDESTNGDPAREPSHVIFHQWQRCVVRIGASDYSMNVGEHWPGPGAPSVRHR